MKRAIWVAVSLMAIGLPASAAEMGGVIEAIEARQDYVPLGKVHFTTGDVWEFYLMTGELSLPIAGSSRTISRYAVFIDVDGDAPMQIVEIGGIECASEIATPGYLLALDDHGRMLAITGAIEKVEDRVTVLTEDAVRKAADYLCKGETPPMKIKDRTLSDFR